MWKALMKLQKNLTWSIPFFMIAGIIFGYYTDARFLKSLIVPMTFLMVYPMMVNLPLSKLAAPGGWKVQIVGQLINFVIIPAASMLIIRLFFADAPLIGLGLLLAALLPTSGMTISWTGFARGDMISAIKMTVFGLILGSLATPLYVKFLMGTVIEIPLAKIFFQIAIVVFLPLVLGNLTQRFILWKFGRAKYEKDIKKKFPALSTVGVLSIVFIAMALKAKTILGSPILLLKLLSPLLILYFINFILSTVIAKFFFKRGEAIALVYGTVMRNLSIALAIAMTVFGKQGSEIAMIIAIAYIIQVQSAAWYVKFTDKIFGKAPEAKARELMHAGLFALHDRATIQDAIAMLDEEHIHSIAVLSDNEKILGLLSSSHIINLLADGKSLLTPLNRVELDPALQIEAGAPVHAILQTMKRKHAYKVLVLNEKGSPSGVLTETDVLEAIKQEAVQ